MSAPSEEGVLWTKSTRSAGNGACVEVAHLSPAVAVRDSKDRSGPILRFDAVGWTAFVGSLRDDRFVPQD
jgi:hypothetical protein